MSQFHKMKNLSLTNNLLHYYLLIWTQRINFSYVLSRRGMLLVMNTNYFNDYVLSSAHRVAMPISTYPGLALTGASVHDIVTNAEIQFQTQVALHERYKTSFVLSAMDLSAESEAFGCSVHLSDSE